MPGLPHQPGPQKGKTTIASQAVVRSLQGHSSAAPVRTSPPTVTFVTNELTQTKSMPKAKEVKVVVASTASPTEDSPPSPQLSRRAYSGSENRQQRQRGYGKRGTLVFSCSRCAVTCVLCGTVCWVKAPFCGLSFAFEWFSLV